MVAERARTAKHFAAAVLTCFRTLYANVDFSIQTCF